MTNEDHRDIFGSVFCSNFFNGCSCITKVSSSVGENCKIHLANKSDKTSFCNFSYYSYVVVNDYEVSDIYWGSFMVVIITVNCYVTLGEERLGTTEEEKNENGVILLILQNVIVFDGGIKDCGCFLDGLLEDFYFFFISGVVGGYLCIICDMNHLIGKDILVSVINVGNV